MVELKVYGKYATGPCLVDEDVAEGLRGRRLNAKPNGYIFFQDRHEDGRLKNVYVHRFITDAPSGMDVDHKNAVRRDNRRKNLRVCSRSQNMANMKRADKGIYWQRNRWHAHIMVNYRLIKLGSFSTKTAALKAYKDAANAHFGEFAA